MPDLSSFSNQTAAARSQEDPLELEFIFSPDSNSALGGRPRPLHGKHKPHRNPNRPGTPLAFWRDVKDVLRRMTFHDRRGSYIAPGADGARNNIVRDPIPTGAGNPPVLHGGGIAQMRPRRSRLDVPPLPPFELPSSFPDSTEQLPITSHIPQDPIIFKGREITFKKPFAYKQEILFIGGTADFVNRAQAQRIMSELLKVMQEHKDVHVTIIGNAASDFQLSGLFILPYGSNKTLLMKSPENGIYDGVPQWGPKHLTMGAFMLARAQAIGNLLISRGIPRSRVHCDIGTLGYGTIDKPNSGALKRRATIIISQKP